MHAQMGLGWAGKVVSVGALVGIVTALLGSLLGQARIYITLGRQYLLSPWLVSRVEAWCLNVRTHFGRPHMAAQLHGCGHLQHAGPAVPTVAVAGEP